MEMGLRESASFYITRFGLDGRGKHLSTCVVYKGKKQEDKWKNKGMTNSAL